MPSFRLPSAGGSLLQPPRRAFLEAGAGVQMNRGTRRLGAPMAVVPFQLLRASGMNTGQLSSCWIRAASPRQSRQFATAIAARRFPWCRAGRRLLSPTAASGERSSMTRFNLYHGGIAIAPLPRLVYGVWLPLHRSTNSNREGPSFSEKGTHHESAYEYLMLCSRYYSVLALLSLYLF